MSSMLDVGDVQPPAYDDTVNESRAQLSCGETPTFYLDRTTIFANTDPPRALYELSNDVSGGDKIRTRLDHIYDFSLDPLAGLESSKLADAVVIEGKMNSKRTHKEIHLVPGVSSWKVKDHFKAGESVMHKLKHADEIQWKNTKGEVIAVETVAKRDAEKKLSCFPQLEIKLAMDDKEMDLLVTSWMARVWRQSASELKEPMNWQDFKTMSKNAFGTKGNRFSVWDLNPGKLF
ncbi:hypothetical protein K4K51_000476 [Colletotrichum sp. SAR 10_75]|nr:hypothetical protein K4K51_000476 [Colletotrichum sp. SAR 10_75]